LRLALIMERLSLARIAIPQQYSIRIESHNVAAHAPTAGFCASIADQQRSQRPRSISSGLPFFWWQHAHRARGPKEKPRAIDSPITSMMLGALFCDTFPTSRFLREVLDD
jgi:hypothetical protein